MSTMIFHEKFWKKTQELTRKELNIFFGIVRGFSNKEIGDVLCITEKTVKFHISHIMSKLGVRSRSQLIVLAFTGNIYKIKNGVRGPEVFFKAVLDETFEEIL